MRSEDAPIARYARYMDKKDLIFAGRHVVITGGNSGIGFAAARLFLAAGARVTIACRNKAKSAAALAALRAEFPHGACAALPLDLADLSSIDAFADALREKKKTDIFYHCAGVYYPNPPKTEEGLSATLTINFTGTAYLAEKVLPLLDENGKMIFTTSLVDRFGKEENFDPRTAKKEGYGTYSASKLLLSAYVLEKSRARQAGEPAFLAVHPGITATALLSPEKTSHKPFFSHVGHRFLFLFTQPKEKAALTVLYAAKYGENGDCIAPRGLFGISGYPHKTRFCHKAARTGRDAAFPETFS